MVVIIDVVRMHSPFRSARNPVRRLEGSNHNGQRAARRSRRALGLHAGGLPYCGIDKGFRLTSNQLAQSQSYFTFTEISIFPASFFSSRFHLHHVVYQSTSTLIAQTLSDRIH